MELNKTITARVIQDARRKAGLTQFELAEKIGINEKHLSKIETGKYYPALDTFLKILDVLNLTLSDFGLKNIEKNSEHKIFLHKVIDASSEKQLSAYADVIAALAEHI